MPGTKGKSSKQDRETARALFERGVPLRVVRDGLVLAVARRELRSSKPRYAVSSLAYFLDAIAECTEQPQDAGYIGHLAGKLTMKREPVVFARRLKGETDAAR